MPAVSVILGGILVGLSVAAFSFRPSLARTGRRIWDWKITFDPESAIHDSYYVVGIHPLTFGLVLLLGVALCIYGFA